MDDDKPTSESTPTLPSAAPARRARLLIIDDERPMRTTLAALLSDRYDVVTADSGAAAIGLLKKDRAFDAVLCDMMMPEVSGVDVYAWIQSEAPALAQKVVFMTGGAFRAYPGRADRAGQRDASSPRREDEGVRMHVESEQRRRATRIRRPATGGFVRRS